MTEQTKEKEIIILPIELINSTLQYLSNQIFNEVSELIEALQKNSIVKKYSEVQNIISKPEQPKEEEINIKTKEDN